MAHQPRQFVIRVLLALTILGTGILLLKMGITLHEALFYPPDPYIAPLSRVQQPLEAFTPQYLKIPSIGVHAPIEQAGLDNHGIMELPSAPEITAWYKLGSHPGAPGSAVITGHLNAVSGPAVFYRLQELRPSDRITVIDQQNQRWEFEVVNIASYPSHDFPLEKVFAPGNTPLLNLITCDGLFDNEEQAYSNRMVVYTQLITSALRVN